MSNRSEVKLVEQLPAQLKALGCSYARINSENEQIRSLKAQLKIKTYLK